MIAVFFSLLFHCLLPFDSMVECGSARNKKQLSPFSSQPFSQRRFFLLHRVIIFHPEPFSRLLAKLVAFSPQLSSSSSVCLTVGLIMKISSVFPSILKEVKEVSPKRQKKMCSFRNLSSVAILNGMFLLVVITIVALPHQRYFSAQAFNDEKGILKWNPYWFSNFRYSAPSSFYISPNRVGTPYKRVSEPTGFSGSTSGGIYKWSPVYFSGGSGFAGQQPSSYYHNSVGTGSVGTGYMYSPNRPLWSLSDYGGSRFLTRYYGGNSYVPSAVQRSPPAAAAPASVIDLAGSNDLSALLGDEMNNGLGLENDTIDILDGENTAAAEQKAR